MARNMRIKRIDDKLRITIDLSKPPEQSKSGKAWSAAETVGMFERLDDVDGMEGYSMSLRLLAPKPVEKASKRRAPDDDTIQPKKKKAKR